jgi:hypothetical protein
MMFREIIAVYCENHTKPINTNWLLKELVHSYHSTINGLATTFRNAEAAKEMCACAILRSEREIDDTLQAIGLY